MPSTFLSNERVHSGEGALNALIDEAPRFAWAAYREEVRRSIGFRDGIPETVD